MPPDVAHRDFGFLWDMRESAREALSFVEGMNEEAYQHDLKTQRATERSLEIIGEAASKVSEAFREAHPGLPWRHMIGLRQRLAHDYGGIRAERILEITQQELVPLVSTLDALLREAS